MNWNAHPWPAGLAAVLLSLTACTTPSTPPVARQPATGGTNSTQSASPARRAHALALHELWIDLVQGDEADQEDVLADLAQAGVVYVGEYHAIPRHHEIQLWLLEELFRRQVPLVLCMEQLEAPDQPAIDRYVARETDFATFAREVDWPNKWREYPAYVKLCDFAREHGIPIRALNAPIAVVRAVNRGGGVAKLPADLRRQLPPEIVLDDPAYERVTSIELGVHAGLDPAKVRPMFEAQVARDEAMAAAIVAARRVDPDKPRTAFVVIGAGHVRYGLGTAARVRRREPGIVERIVLMSESGQLHLSASEEAGKREVNITHGDYRAIERPAADYLRVLPVESTQLPAGHPPVDQLPAGHPVIGRSETRDRAP